MLIAGRLVFYVPIVPDSEVFADIEVGVSGEEFSRVVRDVALRRGARFVDQTHNAVEFLYTWWVNPDNSTARRKMLIDVRICRSPHVSQSLKSLSASLSISQSLSISLSISQYLSGSHPVSQRLSESLSVSLSHSDSESLSL